jgi:geranylgeranyl reductase family protein
MSQLSVAPDVAIVGAGPAGSWAAYRLAQRGVRVTIIDPSHPREKPCGGGVTGRALALVDDAGRLSSSACVIRQARFVESTSGRSARVPLDTDAASHAPLLVMARATFDAALLDAARQAGASLLAERATDVSVETDGVRIETSRRTVRAAVVIGADGATSLVRRRLAGAFGRDELSMATGFFAHGVTSDEIVIEIVGDPPGYLWSFPRPSHLAVGICAQADAGATATALRDRAAGWLRSTGIARGARLEPYAWPIPSLSAARLEHLEIAGRRWCTTGDAAGLVDPITREGIYFALLSAEWAADAAASGCFNTYAARVRSEIVPELARAARLKARFFRLGASSVFIDALQQSAGVNRVMADLIAGRQGYRGLKWRLAQTLEWRWAWRALVSARNNHPGHAPAYPASTP